MRSKLPTSSMQMEALRLTRSSHFDAPICELFLWALVFHRLQQARFYWKMVPDPIGWANSLH